MLHVPDLAVPLYSLCLHLKQHGCGFLGSYETGMLVYFPWFVLLVDTLLDCHLSNKPLGRVALLDTLHYVQLCCPPSLYPSEQPPLPCAVSRNPALIEDDSSAYGSTTDVSSPAEMQPGPTVVPLARLLLLPTAVAALSPSDLSSLDMSSLSSHLCLLVDQVNPSLGLLVSPDPAP